MEDQSIANIVNGIPCSLSNNQLMELGVKCSREGYSLEKMIEISKTLFKNDSESCFKFLEYVQKNQISRATHVDTGNALKCQIYHSLASLFLGKMFRETDKAIFDKSKSEFAIRMNTVSKFKSNEMLTKILVGGFNQYVYGEMQKANNALVGFDYSDQMNKKYVHKQTGSDKVTSVIALLGLAQINFLNRQYEASLNYYKKALIINKKLPSKARLGMAYCFFQLQKYQLAEKCFDRILTLDPHCAQAYMGLGILHYRNGKIDKYFQNFREAHRLKPNDPLVVLHLSEHFLLRGDHQKCLKMCNKGLALIETMPKLQKYQKIRNDYSMFKARFNNLIGQVHHIKNQYEQAAKYYQLASDHGLHYNDIALAQTYIQSNKLQEAFDKMKKVFTSKSIRLKTVADFYKMYGYLKMKHPSPDDNENNNAEFYYKQYSKFSKNTDYYFLIEYAMCLKTAMKNKKAIQCLQLADKMIKEQGGASPVELVNNIGVLHAEEKLYGQALQQFERATFLLNNYPPRNTNEEQKVYMTLFLTVHFNKAIALQMSHKFQQAIQILNNLIGQNKYFAEAYVRLADVYHELGRMKDAHFLIDTAILEFTKSNLKYYKINYLYIFKAFLLHADGGVNEARHTIEKGCPKQFVSQHLNQSEIAYIGRLFPYERIYYLSLQQQYAAGKQPEHQKKFFMKATTELLNIQQFKNKSNVYIYMFYLILLLERSKLRKDQATTYFNLLKVAEQQFPIIQYNYGVFSMLSQDYQNALKCFIKYEEKTKSRKAGQYLALTYFLKGDLKTCIRAIQKNITSDPNNLRFKYQLAFVHQKRVQKLYEGLQENKQIKQVKSALQYLNMSEKIYAFLQKINSNQYAKLASNGEMKEKIRMQISNIKNQCNQRLKFVKSQIPFYQDRQIYVLKRQQQIKEQEDKKREELRRIQQKRKQFEQNNSDDGYDSEKQRKQRRRKYAELALMQNQKLQQAKLQQQQQKLNQNQDGKRKRKPKQPKKVKKEREKNMSDQKMDEQYPSQQQFKQQQFSEQQQNEYEQDEGEEIERKKKKKKHMDRERNRDDSQEKEKKKRKQKKRARKQRQAQQERNRYKQDKNQEMENEISDEQANPFDEDEKINKKKGDAKDKQQKEKKKEKNEDQFDYDLEDFLVKDN